MSAGGGSDDHGGSSLGGKSANLAARWLELDRTIARWWDGDLRTAVEGDICHAEIDWTWLETIKSIGSVKIEAPPAPTLLFLPFPFSPAGGDQGAFPEMYAWDTYFIVRGFLDHGRYDLARDALLNQLFMILRFGKVLNANRSYFVTRSQPPLHPDAIWRYFEATGDRDLLLMAYPLLRREYTEYWNDEEHLTPTGLSTARDKRDPYLRSELASEAEAGLDFSPVYEGDVESCVPVATNSQLVRYADVLGQIAQELGFMDEARHWTEEAQRRTLLIGDHCWVDDEGFFLEYNYVDDRHIPVRSLCAYWTLWAGVATPKQAARLVDSLRLFEHGHGLTITDREYPSPFPEFSSLQWSFPYCWPPYMVMVVDGLKKYGYDDVAERIGRNYLAGVIREFDVTGSLWEKYVATGANEQSTERYERAKFHGWSSASVVVIGRMVGLAGAG